MGFLCTGLLIGAVIGIPLFFVMQLFIDQKAWHCPYCRSTLKAARAACPNCGRLWHDW